MILCVTSEWIIAYKKIYFSSFLLELSVGGQCRITKQRLPKSYEKCL